MASHPSRLVPVGTRRSATELPPGRLPASLAVRRNLTCRVVARPLKRWTPGPGWVRWRGVDGGFGAFDGSAAEGGAQLVLGGALFGRDTVLDGRERLDVLDATGAASFDRRTSLSEATGMTWPRTSTRRALRTRSS